jgi:hypothetical protein
MLNTLVNYIIYLTMRAHKCANIRYICNVKKGTWTYMASDMLTVNKPK